MVLDFHDSEQVEQWLISMLETRLSMIAKLIDVLPSLRNLLFAKLPTQTIRAEPETRVSEETTRTSYAESGYGARRDRNDPIKFTFLEYERLKLTYEVSLEKRALVMLT